MEDKTLYTIGQLAKRVGLNTSTLRFYEEEGLLTPATRTRAGYRLYDPDAEGTLTFIQRAQRIGFSLADIKLLMGGEGALRDATVVEAAEARLVALEKQLTELLVARHELSLFLLDFRTRMTGGEGDSGIAGELYDRLVGHVCGHDHGALSARTPLEWLLERTGCALAKLDPEQLVRALRGHHVHVWRDGADYCILVASHDADVERALEALAQLEAECHAHPTPSLSRGEEGYLFVARGDNAFLFAQLFLALEGEARRLKPG